MTQGSQRPGPAVTRFLAILAVLALIGAACGQASAPAPVASAAPSVAPAAAAPSAAPTVAPLKPERNTLKVITATPPDVTFVHDLQAFAILEQKYGVKTSVEFISGSDAVLKAVAGKQVDAGYASYASGIAAIAAGVDLVVPMPSVFTGYHVIAVDGKKIKSWKNFEGATVGNTAPSDSSYWLTAIMLEKYGVDVKKVNWVAVRGSVARAAALDAGKIDAAALHVSQMVDLSRTRTDLVPFGLPGKEFPDILFIGYWMSRQFTQQNPQLMQAWADALLEAERAVQDKATYLSLVKKFLPDVSLDTAEKTYAIMADLQIWDPDFKRWNATAGAYTTKIMAQYQAIEKDLPWASWADTKFTQAALQRLGPFKK